MGDLYICHTAYQVLIALLRALRSGKSDNGIVLSAGIPQAGALCGRLLGCGAFSAADTVDEGKWPGTVTGVLAAERNRRAFEQKCGWRLPRGQYDNIYISNDWSALGRYLQDCRAGYILCEDTLGGTLDADQHLILQQRAQPDFAARQKSGKGYLYWGDSRWCAKIESEDAEKCVIFPPQKLATYSKAALLASLAKSEKAAVRRVFITEPLPDNPAAFANATLLLPRSFVLDGLMSQREQDAMFKAVAAKYCDGKLFIKTHPRDETDYQALFPTATVLGRTMPSEVLNFCLPGKFKRAVTVQSWVLRGFTAAEENIFLTLDEAKALIKG